MCNRPTTPTAPPTTGLPLMAVADLRDALTALDEGKPATALAALAAIDPASWQLIAQRLREVLHTLV